MSNAVSGLRTCARTASTAAEWAEQCDIEAPELDAVRAAAITALQWAAAALEMVADALEEGETEAPSAARDIVDAVNQAASVIAQRERRAAEFAAKWRT